LKQQNADLAIFGGTGPKRKSSKTRIETSQWIFEGGDVIRSKKEIQQNKD